MRALNNSAVGNFVAKHAEPSSDAYSARVARPIMDAVDRMPAEYRALVNEIGYIEVYLAWRQGHSVDRIRRSAGGCCG